MKTIFLSIITFFTLKASCQDTIYFHKIEYEALISYEFPKSPGFNASVTIPTHRTATVLNYPFTSQHISFEVGLSRYPYNSSQFTASASYLFRKYKSEHYFTEWGILSGVLRTFYDGIVYEVNTAGEIKTKPLYGRYYAISGLSYSINWNLEKNQNRFFLQLRPSYYIQYPFNSIIKMHFSLALGIKYSRNKKKSFISHL